MVDLREDALSDGQTMTQECRYDDDDRYSRPAPAPCGSPTAGCSLDAGVRTAVLHPLWLRCRSEEPGQIEPVSRQRLFTPLDLALDVVVHRLRRSRAT